MNNLQDAPFDMPDPTDHAVRDDDAAGQYSPLRCVSMLKHLLVIARVVNGPIQTYRQPDDSGEQRFKLIRQRFTFSTTDDSEFFADVDPGWSDGAMVWMRLRVSDVVISLDPELHLHSSSQFIISQLGGLRRAMAVMDEISFLERHAMSHALKAACQL